MKEKVALYEDEWSAEIYDYQVESTADVSFWLSLARESGGPGLELACGTGRVLLALARAGLEVTGLDLSPYMLAVARQKLAQEARDVQARVRLVEASMADFSLDRSFGLIYIPARAFQGLLTRARQQACLESCRQHLRPGGRLAVDVFNPLLSKLIAPGGVDEEPDEFTGPRGAAVQQDAHTDYDLAEQTLLSVWRYETTCERGAPVVHEYALRLHYFFRFEMEWMLEVCGVEVEALYGDFDRSQFTAESPEMIFVARQKEEGQ